MTYNIGRELRVVGCTGENHPHACTARLAYPDGLLANGGESVPYQWIFHRDLGGPRAGSSYHQLTEQERSLIGDFLEAHGIVPVTRFMEGSAITVRVRCDGTLMVHTWRAVLNADGVRQICHTCPNCVMQERVVTPLTTAVPEVTGAFVARRITSMPRRQPADIRPPRVTFVAPPPSPPRTDRIRQSVDHSEHTTRHRSPS
jgi:hypothetical protein